MIKKENNIKTKYCYTALRQTSPERILIIEWNDGTRSEEAVGDVMRLD